MIDRRLIRLFVDTLLATAVAGVCAYEACVYAASLHLSRETASFATFVFAFGIPESFIIRHWLREGRRGRLIDSGLVSLENVVGGAQTVGLMLGAFALNLVLFDVTGNRLAQVTVGLLLEAAAAFFVVRATYARMPLPKPSEASQLKASALAFTFMSLSFCFSLCTQLIDRVREADLIAIHNVNIALSLTLIPLGPIMAYFIWQRYLDARKAAFSRIS